MKYSPIKLTDFAKYPAAHRNCTKCCTGCKVELVKIDTEHANMYVNEEGKTRFVCDGRKEVEELSEAFDGYGKIMLESLKKKRVSDLDKWEEVLTDSKK